MYLVEKYRKVLAVRFMNHYTLAMSKFFLSFVIILFGSFVWAAESIDSQSITAEQLLPLLGKPDLIIIDVRTKYDWDTSKVKIKGAVREESMKFGSWMKKYPKNKKIVLYCD